MPQRPSPLNLILCDQVVFEQGTQKPYLLGMFTGVAAESFPTERQRFDIFAALTDGLGDVTMTLSVARMEANQEIYSQTMTVSFPDPLRVVNLRFRVRQLIYEAPGTYLFALTTKDRDGEVEIAARRVRVYQK
ncbi:MAG: hypothetical protein L0Y72_22390 [Gemmataceae bacterium]|nr:hypothetical protein [Gemmataceae bacterium]MCI0741792.1 hypothetical protein [Gemmataceae bacterium]